jgi:flagellar biosynthetic protein FliQ
MNIDSVVQIIREALMAAFWLSAPILMIGFAVGIVVSLVQIVTSIQDSAVSTVPKLAAVLVGVVLAMPWMLQKAVAYTSSILGNLSQYAR